ncbi:S41 family peptidase [Phaeocystidibacter luteus]|uniref:Peptidase S41 n=1 Tax=Phaeocystidibacter luteus TaxID=911197 RepID=A0A6N6RCG6_9FLAO|nr:S41 family peptidase [Phaeocystidibacter luteus]KAB2804302.1 peptidase S41 [Phaeocystidibacter luteus]
MQFRIVSRLTFILVLGGGSVFGQAKFSPEQVRADLEYANRVIHNAQYNPYLYSSEEALDSALTFALSSVGEDSVSARSANSIIQRFVSNVNNGHTSLTPPFQEYIAYAQGGGTVFPLDLSLDDKWIHVKAAYCTEPELTEGVRILSIDGRPIEEVIEELGYYVPAEDDYFKRAKMESLSFPRLYWIAHGRKDSFDIEVQIANELVRYRVAAVPAIEGFEMKHDEVLNAAMYIEVNDNAALLNPGPFGGDLDAFKSFIDSAFHIIVDSRAQELYIDLRNNPGGDDAFSDYMVSYIADEPFKWSSEFYLRSSAVLKEHTLKNSDTSTAYARSILNAEDGVMYEFDFGKYDPQLERKRFRGDVYVLINRQTHSQACVTAAQLADYGWGTLVGETTGEYPSLCASLFPVTLPQTGFVLQVSKGYIVRVNGDTSHEGLTPMQEVEIPNGNEELMKWIGER